MVNLVKHDLEFILKQIKIAEAHSAGTKLTEIYVDQNGNVVPQGTAGAVLAISHPLAPYGLRTVDGSFNNMIPGREEWGAADNPFPQLTDRYYRDEDDDAMPSPGYVGPDADNPGGQNNDYGDHTSLPIGSNGQPSGLPGTVVDADPRIISNLIVDQTLNNPAAIYAALVYAGYSGAQLNTALNAIIAAKATLDATIEDTEGTLDIPTLQAAVDAAELALANAQTEAEGAATALEEAETENTAAQSALVSAEAARADAKAALDALMDDGITDPAAELAAFTAWQAEDAAFNQAQSEAQAAATALADATSAAAIANAAVISATGALAAAETALAEAEQGGAAVIAAQAALDTLLETHGVEMQGNSVVIPNVAPDEGLSAPYNSWFTLFGQFFDHGLDLVAKGGGTVFIPLQPDDPLYNPATPFTNFMVLTRTTPDAENLTTPWVDQNQTYSSHASKQLFMREYEMTGDGPLSTGRLLSGERGLATWADVKKQAAEKLGFQLTDAHVGNIPLFVVDEYGEFIRGENGFPQLVAGLGTDGLLGTADDVLIEGDPTANGGLGVAIPATALRTGHAFIDDIAHTAKTVNDRGQALAADSDDAVGLAAGTLVYDDELLDAHYVTGDGRGNENIGLSAVHHIFHSEHNHVVDQVKAKALAEGDLDFLNEWLRVDVAAIPTTPEAIAALQWDGERLFQAARFTTEMQYQHLVFEEFARKIQPDVDAFVFNPSTDINPAIFAEFAHVIYRFGHSMLTETVDIVNADGTPNHLDLFDAFLNPLAFGSETVSHDEAAGAIVRGMTAQHGNEIDEFVTNVLRNQLLGIPLDLAAINIARGRDAGIPPLNEARRQFQAAANGDTQLEAYKSWTDFALNLKNPASIVNFIAAYGTHTSITSVTSVEAKRAAAMELVFGTDMNGDGQVAADRLEFLNATGAYAGGKLGGLEDVDLWVGGLAEKKMAFGGMLGSTFSFIFELQLENLQNGDRFYYLSRVQGLNFLNELENNSFAKMVLANTDLGETGYAVPGDIFSLPDHVLYMDKNKQTLFGYQDPVQEDPFLQALSPMVERQDLIGADGLAGSDGVAEYIRVNTNDHVLIQGTDGDDTIISGGGDDSVWGGKGNDRIEAGYGVDKIHGGEGDDIITNNGTDIGEVDMLHGEQGNDVIHGGSGLALVFGNEGDDYIIAGPDGKEVFGGLDNDFILGGEGGDFLLGNEGDDWIEGGGGFDTTAGDNSELFFNSTIIGHDVMFAGTDEHDFDAESGDDIMVQGESVMRNEGMLGFDWAIHKGNAQNGESDLTKPIFTTDEQDILRDRFDAVEALSGWDKNDHLWGDNRGDVNLEGEVEGTPGLAGAENTMVGHELDQAGIARIAGLNQIVTSDLLETVEYQADGSGDTKLAFVGGNILLGGGGSDVIEGRGGDDIIDGDRWLNVRIRITHEGQTYTADGMTGKVYLQSALVDGAIPANAEAQFGGKTLNTLMLERAFNPSQLEIVREIVTDNGAGDTDVAAYWDVRDNYTITRGANGEIVVSHTGFDPDNVPAGTNLVSDGVDRLRNIEVLRFADGDVVLTPPELYLQRMTAQFAESFGSTSYTTSDGNWTQDWVESEDDNDNDGANGQIRIDDGRLEFDAGNNAANSNGASIQRGLTGLTGASSATISFSFTENIDAGETVTVQFSRDGTEANLQQVQVITSASGTGVGGTGSVTNLPLVGPFTVDAFIRFTVSAMNAGDNDFVSIDNIAIDAVLDQDLNYTTTFTEGGADQDIASNPLIVEGDGEIVSARIVLTNAQAGDAFDIPGNLPGNINSNIDTSVPGQIIVTLTGEETIANYQAAIQAIQFRNTSQNPSNVDRIIQVTVNDGLMDSNVATTTVNVVPVDDDVNANNDSVITNISGATSIVIPKWALLFNDTDPDSAFSITGVSGANSLTDLNHSATSVMFADPVTGGAGGSFAYTATGAPGDTDNAQVTVTRDVTGTIDGTGGNNILVGSDAGNTFDAGTGDDIVFAGGGTDAVVWNANTATANSLNNSDGRDIIDGGDGTDTFTVNGNNNSELYRIYTRDAAAAAGIVGLNAITEIVITRGAANTVIAELESIEEISINTAGGAGDDIQVFGDFTGTSLNLNTITINGSQGDDTVDISSLTSAHRIVFKSNGGNDTIIGTLRPQDVIELPNGQTLDDYTSTTFANGTTTYANGTHTITLLNSADSDDEVIDGAFGYTESDIAGLKAMVNGQQPAQAGDDDVPVGVRELSGYNNNVAHPTWGNADGMFIRLTEARYGEYNEAIGNRDINPVFEGLDARNISNILGAQEAGLPHAGNDANIFFMAMGQYIDHGLDFLPKGGNGSIEIGAPGTGHPGAPVANPADLTRGTVHHIDENGIPQHQNQTSPYVDQNQAYGSHSLVGQFLRESDGNQGYGMRLLAGAPDPSNPDFSLLPTLRELIQHHWQANTIFTDPDLPGGAISFREYYTNYQISEGVTGTLFNEANGAYDPQILSKVISNFMGSGQPLLLDTNPYISVLDHYVAGDGRANENFALTSIHTIWARNHNYHVEGLLAAGFEGTPEEVFQAAKMLNEAEYQRVVFDEYLETLLGGLRSDGTHGFEEYNPNVDTSISHEFAGAVFRFGHSLIGQTMTVLDADGNPQQVSLFDAFLNPSNDPSVFTMPLDQLAQYGYVPQPGYAQHGVNSIIGGTLSQPAENVDFNIVDAVRNDLVRISADLFSFNVTRGWDLGIGTLNQVRKDLAASTNPYVSEAVGFAGGDLSAYTSWEDFQDRNDLTDAVIAQFKQAYPDLVLEPVDIPAFQQVNPDIEVTIRDDGKGVVKGIDRLDLWVGGLAEKHINGGVVGQTFWVVLHEQFERLQDGDRFYYISRFDDFDFYENFIDGQEFADIVARNTGMTDLPEHLFETEELEDEDDDDENDGDTGNDDDEDSDGDDGTDEDDESDGDDTDDDEDDDDTDEDDDGDDDSDDEEDDDETDGDDNDDDDDTDGDDDDDVAPTPAPTTPHRTGTSQSDVLIGTAEANNVVAFAGDDVAIGEAGDDSISAGEGSDFVNAGDGRDVVFAGAGDDQVFGGAGADMLYGDAGADHIFGDDGDDMINAGAGADTVFGGVGNDMFIAEAGDGNDLYFGDEGNGGVGVDTLDMSAATSNVQVHLGNGSLMLGYATGGETGHDTLWAIENVNTGLGNDTITASNAVNVMNGGAGNDTFVFETAAAADGDTIVGFQPGDRLDLSGIDANTATAANESFTLINGGTFTAAGQIAVTFETREDGEYTVVSGNVNADTEADFKIELEGHRTLTNSNFNL